MKPRTVNGLWKACVAERKKGSECHPIHYDLTPTVNFDESVLMLGDLKKEDCIILG